MQDKPETATMYSKLSGHFLRWNDGILEVYCQYAKVWQASAIKDLNLAQVVNIQ